jgi:hypothetical protein
VLTLTIDTTPPTITTPATASVNEGVVLAIALTANETVTWTESFDAGNNFEVSGSTLRWTGNGVKAYTGTGDNYACEVTAVDVAGNVGAKSITVTVLQVSVTKRAFSAEGISVTGGVGSTREWSANSVAFVES